MLLAHPTMVLSGISQCMTELLNEPGKFMLSRGVNGAEAFTRCTNSSNTLQCLRDLPYETIYGAAYEGLEWFATVDDKFISQFPQISYKENKIAKVPILLGTNTDEGTSFGTTGTDTAEECIEQLTCLFLLITTYSTDGPGANSDSS